MTRVCWGVEISRQRPPVPLVPLVDGHLAQRQVLAVLKGARGKDQKVAVGQHGLPVGHEVPAVPGDHHGQQVVRQGQLGQRLADPGMAVRDVDLDEVDVVVLLVVVEGLGHVLGRVDHVQPARHPRQQRALEGDGQ